jgi:hypothetical protein
MNLNLFINILYYVVTQSNNKKIIKMSISIHQVYALIRSITADVYHFSTYL